MQYGSVIISLAIVIAFAMATPLSGQSEPDKKIDSISLAIYNLDKRINKADAKLDSIIPAMSESERHIQEINIIVSEIKKRLSDSKKPQRVIVKREIIYLPKTDTIYIESKSSYEVPLKEPTLKKKNNFLRKIFKGL